MNEAEGRRWLAGALESCSVYALRRQGLVDAFVGGDLDLPLADLEMDSLAEMELCIAIEVETGFTVVPETLRDHESLGALARLVAGVTA